MNGATLKPIAGRVDSKGVAWFKFLLWGFDRKAGKALAPQMVIEGILDTGFDGFLQIPYLHAAVMRIPTPATGRTRLANGTVVSQPIGLGLANFGGKLKVGTVAVSPAQSPPLIGIDFLRRFEMMLVFSYQAGAFLIDESSLPISSPNQASP